MRSHARRTSASLSGNAVPPVRPDAPTFASVDLWDISGPADHVSSIEEIVGPFDTV